MRPTIEADFEGYQVDLVTARYHFFTVMVVFPYWWLSWRHYKNRVSEKEEGCAAE